jgi:hypothetical protein
MYLPAGAADWVPRLQHFRRLAKARLSLLRQVLLPITMLDYRNYRDQLGHQTEQSSATENGLFRKALVAFPASAVSRATRKQDLDVLQFQQIGPRENCSSTLLRGKTAQSATGFNRPLNYQQSRAAIRFQQNLRPPRRGELCPIESPA